MKTIYLLLTRSDTVLSRVVRLVTASHYTHVSIAFDESLQTVYSSSRKNGRTLFPAGPCQEHLERGYWGEHGHVPCILYELQVSDQAYRAAQWEVERILRRQGEYHFNILGLILGLILCQMNIPFHRKHHFFCSQFVGMVLGRSGALCLPKDPSVMKPCDYMVMPEHTFEPDSSALLDLASRTRRYTNTFRVSITLTEAVDPHLLQTAVDRIAPRFPMIAAAYGGASANTRWFQPKLRRKHSRSGPAWPV